ncbi:MAG TPA: hypothetical protein VI193_08535, partial [Acidimicrobiia bacterium]
MGLPLSQEILEAADCWETADRVPGPPAMTEFRRALRYHQAMWREANGHPIGTQPIRPRPRVPVRLVGSNLPLEYAKETGATFLNVAALDAARARTSFIEREQSFDHQGLWADLLSSTAMTFNLFGELAADTALADRAVHTWWPDTPGTVSEVRFAHSPGRLDPAYLGNLSDFDVAFVLDLEDGSNGIIGLNVNYHQVTQRHVPKPERLPRYLEIAKRAKIFTPDALKGVNRTDLLVMWLTHLLVLSMVQHPSRAWTWGRMVV